MCVGEREKRERKRGGPASLSRLWNKVNAQMCDLRRVRCLHWLRGLLKFWMCEFDSWEVGQPVERRKFMWVALWGRQVVSSPSYSSNYFFVGCQFYVANPTCIRLSCLALGIPHKKEKKCAWNRERELGRVGETWGPQAQAPKHNRIRSCCDRNMGSYRL